MSMEFIPLMIVFTFIILLIFLLFALYLKVKKLKKRVGLAESQLHKEKEQQQALATELTALKEKVVHDLLYDALTGLPGRQVFEDHLQQIINQSKRFQLTFAVLFVDLDDFKKINDVFGYQSGDEIIKEVSLRLQNSIRKVDTVSRFSNNEFAIIAAQLAKPESVVYIAQRILNSLSEPFKLNNKELTISASIGISIFPIDAIETESLLKNATIALNQAKLRKNTYQFYHADMQALTQRELVISVSLQKDMLYKNFRITYQPQIDCIRKKMTGICALLNWNHPEYGLMPLTDFIRQAERSGKMNEIGDWFIRKVLEQYKTWQEADVGIKSIALAVSSRQLENPSFAYKLSQLFQEMKLNPSCLVLEISETALLTKLDVIEKVLNMLKHLGVHITLTDFGSDNLHLQQLKRFPIDSLKIASSLIQDITKNESNAVIVKMIIAIANSLQMNVFALDVKTNEQLNLLKELGCHALQGSLISEPLIASEITQKKLDAMLIGNN